MFARKVAVLLKPDALRQFTTIMENEILPWLRRQPGFLDLIMLAVPNSSEVATISFWDHEGDAQAYDSTGYPEVVQRLQKLLDGTPYVKTFEVVSSTLHQIATESDIGALSATEVPHFSTFARSEEFVAVAGKYRPG